MNDEQIIETLNKLIGLCMNGYLSYQRIANAIPSTDECKSIFQDSAEQRRIFSVELINLVVSLGGNPRPRRVDSQLSLASTTFSMAYILDNCETRETQTRQAYEEALSRPFPRIKRSTVKRQYRAVLMTQAQFDRLRNHMGVVQY